MTKQHFTKFAKRNLVLQEKLEKFLIWRKKTVIKKQVDVKLNEIKKFQSKNTSFRHFLKNRSLKTKFIKYEVSTSSSKLYKPISLHFLQSFLKPSFFNPEFFPEKKPFMQFWVFPLMGACLFHVLNSDQSKSFAKTHSSSLYSLQNEQKTKTSIGYFDQGMTGKDNDFNSFWGTPNFGAFEEMETLNFSANYLPSTVQKSGSRSDQFENLCRFYLNLTDQKLKNGLLTDSLNNPNDEKFFEKNLLKSIYFQNAQFNWVWYSLHTDFLNSQFKKSSLDQKLDNQNLFGVINSRINENNTDLSLNLKNPIISYYQASKLFDLWNQSIQLNTLKNSSITKDHETLSKKSFEFLEKIYEYEIQSKDFLNENNKLISYLSNLLQELETNEKELKSSFLNEKTIETVDQSPQRLLEYSNDSLKNAFFKVLLKNTLLKINVKTSLNKKMDNFEIQRNLLSKPHLKNILNSTLFNLQASKNQINKLLQSESKLNVDESSKLQSKVKELLILQQLKNHMNQVHFENAFKEEEKTKKNSKSINVLSSKFIQNIKLYQQLNQISNKILKFPQMKYSGFDSSQKISQYKTPILKTSLSNSKTSEEPTSVFVYSAKPLPIFTELNGLKSSLKTPMLSSNHLSVYNQNLLNHLTSNIKEVESNLSKLIKRAGNIQGFQKEQKERDLQKEALFISNLKDSQIKRFDIVKKFHTTENQPIYLLKTLNRFTSKKGTKVFKQKGDYESQPILLNNQNRKFEKIFRAYFSVKNMERNSLNVKGENKDFKRIQPFLKKLKNKLKYKKFSTLKPVNYALSELKEDFRNREKLQVIRNSSTFLNKKSKLKRREKNLIKRVTFDEPFLTKLESFHFLKSSDFLKNPYDSMAFEKKKSLQKKRRLKKLKLENRRRKKRKRFYPRPNSLRVQLYFQFLRNRHSYKLSENLSPLGIQEFKLKEKIHGQKMNKKEKYMNESFFQIKPISHEKEFYKISNQTLTEFERLCWKSYWLRSNLKPYIRRIQNNLKQMQDSERHKSSEVFLTKLFENLTYPLQNSFRLREFDNQKLNTQWTPYLNLKETTGSHLSETSTPFFREFQKSQEYEKILYERVIEEIKNVKNQLNVNGQSQPRSYKVGRLKIEKVPEKRILNSLSSIQNNYFNPQLSGSVLDPLVLSSSVPSFGDLPTLRVLWALNKTQLFTYKQNNFSKQLWTLYKQREQTKNNKTRKFFLKYSPFKVKNLDTLSKEKTKVSLKKIQLFGGRVLGNHSQTYLRKLRFQLQNSSAKHSQDFNPTYWFETNFQNKLQKRRIHFWWLGGQSTLTETSVPFFIFSAPIMSQFVESFGKNSNFLALQYTNLDSIVMTTSLWIGCCLFHLAIFFTLIRIPEIRSLLKFQFLILSKLSNAYLIGLFSIYDILKNYKMKLSLIFKKFKAVSFNQSLYSNKGSNTLKITPSFTMTRSKYSILETNLFPTKIVTNPLRNSKLRYTLNLDFQYRDFSDLFKLRLKNANSSFDSKLLTQLYEVLTYSIHPAVTQLNLTERKKLESTKDFIFSSSTGFLWTHFSKQFNSKEFLTKKQFYLKEFLKNSEVKKTQLNSLGKKKININDSNTNVSTHKTNALSTVESNFRIQYVLSLGILSLTKMILGIFYQTIQFIYHLILKGIDFLESILLLFYKFLEKPAELMVDWIADIFLIEWSSDITTYVPEAFDMNVGISFKKWSRGTRFFGNLPAGFILQRLIFNTSEIFYSWLIKQDADLMARQKKGVIFWDIWGELLIQAAEKYKMNLSSLNTVKEEQELLIENLLEEKSVQKSEKTELTQKSKKQSSPNFLNSEEFKESIFKMKPLTKFLHNFPLTPEMKTSVFLKKLEKDSVQSLANSFRLEDFFLSTQFKNDVLVESDLFETKKSMDSWKRWSVNQYLTTQGRDTDLFMDIHPPKSFAQLRFLKSYLPAQEILGSLACEIYSGLFPTKISKNILIVGAPGTTKSIFIQALAGETELKIVTDNAHRYSFVNNGIPVGMKLLREVFDSLALHTPCLFVLEDIHIIGERRPMLLSDDEISKTKDSTFGADQDEVHEKNRLLYQFSRHAISHYKKPYKGDFSSSLATNHFAYDLFLGVQPPRKRKSNLTVKNPLPLTRIERTLNGQDINISNNLDEQGAVRKNRIFSSLQISMEQIFAPPATSPFNILLMKEQKKLKPKKVVKEMPWSGLSYDQLMLLSKSHYSVRVKVALLAESAMTNLSMKLDMITDLLVIIDSVRSNRGFVVFGTTHVPSLLDPALRRPGRFDETLSVPVLPNLTTRFEILRTGLNSYTQMFDLFDLSLFTSKEKQTETEISQKINKIRLLLLNSKNSPAFNLSSNLLQSRIFSNFHNDYSIYSIEQAFQTTIQQNSLLLNINKLQKLTKKKFKLQNRNIEVTNQFKKASLKDLLTNQEMSKTFIFSGHDKLNYIALSYAQAGQFLVESLLVKDQQSYTGKFLMSSNTPSEFSNTEQSLYQVLYASKIESENLLLKLFAGKISEFFILNPNNIISENAENQVTSLTALGTNPSSFSLFENTENFQSYWQSAISFLTALSQKRYLYNKHQLVSKMLLVEDQQILREPPSPPNSSILMPAKKFENYKRTLKDFIQKPMMTINEKLQIHQKQRFLKLLYNVPVQKSFKTFSKSNENNLSQSKIQVTNFYNSFRELGYLDLLTVKPSSTYAFYKNRFLTRHRFSFLNQWWNGQLAEHTVETTYLSHVDWRSMFVQSLGDLVIDFPDADQYYNPRKRRWYLHSNSWSYWFDFEKNLQKEISEHSILQCFTKTSNLLNSNREMFDYLSYRFLRYHQLKEIDLIQTLVRFYKSEDSQIN